MSSSSLYDRIGGEAAVTATVKKLYEKIMKDPLLAPLFSYDRLGMLEHHQIAFVTAAFGGPNKYTGRRLREVHQPMVDKGVGDRHFDAVLNHLAASMRELNVAEPLIAEAAIIVESTRSEVLGRA